MEECTVQIKPVLTLHRRRPYPKNTPLLPVNGFNQRRGLLKFWRRARQRHVQARVTWRSKLNRYLLP
mgnify:FL=1